MKQSVGDDGESLFLPEEIITNILKRLPVKSLIRFQCVSKHWKNLIKSPSFIACHLHHSRIQNPPSLLFQRKEGADPLDFFVLDCEMQAHDVQKPPPFISNMHRASIIGSCNGLVCVKSSSSAPRCISLSLWNPATREVRDVRVLSGRDAYGDVYYGFGFSTIIDDYRIVKVDRVHSEDSDFSVEVYSLRSNSWRVLEFGNLVGVETLWQGNNADGYIFWRADWTKIVLFDMATEVTRVIRGPKLARDLNVGAVTMRDKKLCLVCQTKIGSFEYSTIEFWMMEEGVDASAGKKWSWTKMYNSSTYPGVLYPMIIWRNEIVCIVCEMPGVITVGESKTVISLSNPSTTEIKVITICTRSRTWLQIYDYVESLVSVGNIHNEEP